MSGSPQRATVVVTNPQGFPHASHGRLRRAGGPLPERPSAVRREEVRANGKSILDLMRLAAEQGTELTVEADGPRRRRRPGWPWSP